jgi:16S rRNA (adenine1518-N6/adenine1519-N6)-dimethyltransferase
VTGAPPPDPSAPSRSEKRWLRRGSVRPRRSLGQNFLVNPRVRDALVARWDIAAADTVVEIGAGAGALTIPLLDRARRVIAVERDRSLCLLLALRAAEERPGAALEILHRDARRLDPRELTSAGGRPPMVLVGNLPYAVTSPLLLWILENRRLFRWASIMVQREYAARLLVSPGSPGGSSLTVWTAFHARVELEMKVSAGAFWPRPDVDSTVVRMIPRAASPFPLEDPAWLEKSLRASFGQRRKQLGGALASAMGWSRPDADRLLGGLGLDPARRGETLTLEEHVRLAARVGPLLP